MRAVVDCSSGGPWSRPVSVVPSDGSPARRALQALEDADIEVAADRGAALERLEGLGRDVPVTVGDLVDAGLLRTEQR